MRPFIAKAFPRPERLKAVHILHIAGLLFAGVHGAGLELALKKPDRQWARAPFAFVVPGMSGDFFML
jgi:hypothetical protein